MSRAGNFSVHWTKGARDDVYDIADYIALDSLDVADEVAEKIDRNGRALALSPRRGRVVPELHGRHMSHIRELIVYPWRLFYQVGPTTVTIFAVVDGRRHLDEQLLERLMRR